MLTETSLIDNDILLNTIIITVMSDLLILYVTVSKKKDMYFVTCASCVRNMFDSNNILLQCIH